jgi:hypothetical protein
MSLIDDALKRAQEASRRGPTPSRPWTPAPLPDAGLARRRAVTRAALWTLGGLAAIVLLTWGAQAVWNAASSPEPKPRASATGIVAPVPTTVPTLSASVVSTPPPLRAAASSPEPTRPRPTRVAIPETPDVSQAVVEVAPPASALKDGQTYVGVVVLPDGARIELGGIVWSEEEPRALLNERIVATDAYVAGFTVAKIEENRVALVRDGMTIYLALK